MRKGRLKINKRSKKVKGITLVALVITIIALLILAGVTIGVLTGKNGLLNKAKSASEESMKQTASEKINLKIMYHALATCPDDVLYALPESTTRPLLYSV